MRRELKLALMAGVSMFFWLKPGFAQTQGSSDVTIIINSIAALRISGGNVTLTIQAPATAGESPQNATDSNCYLQYTSGLPAGQSRRITAAWSAGDSAPAGCSLRLQALPSGTSGEGTAAGEITLSTTAQNVVTGITRCATGTGSASGARLIYTLSVDSVTSLVAGEAKAVTITFTLTDAS